MSWNPWLTSLLRLYRKACYANKPRGPVSILSVLFFIPFCRFRGNNRFEGERFPTEEVVIVFSLCHINCMKILTTIIYLFHIKTWNFLYKNPRVFYSIFYRNKHRKQASFWLHNITKTILLFHFSPKPTAEGETKRQQSKQLQFHKITRKKKNICRTPTIWRQSNLPSDISQFVPWSKLSNLSALHWTLPIPKTRKRLKCIHSQINSSKHIKINWFSDCKWSQHYSKFLSTIPHLRE